MRNLVVFACDQTGPWGRMPDTMPTPKDKNGNDIIVGAKVLVECEVVFTSPHPGGFNTRIRPVAPDGWPINARPEVEINSVLLEIVEPAPADLPDPVNADPAANPEAQIGTLEHEGGSSSSGSSESEGSQSSSSGEPADPVFGTPVLPSESSNSSESSSSFSDPV